MKRTPEILAEYIDRLCTLEIKPGGGKIPRGVAIKLYDAARKKQGKPLTYLAANLFIDRVPERAWMGLHRDGGRGPPSYPRARSTGLPGAASVARALDLGLGVKSVIVGDERIRILSGGFSAAGVTILDEETAKQGRIRAIFEPVALDDETARSDRRSFSTSTGPRTMIAIERLGPSRSGQIHGATGINYTKEHAKLHYLFDMAPDRKIKTIGIGDMGNEIGFGLILDDVLKISPWGAKCQCPCGMGMATVTATDVLVVGAISNWGAYGISAVLAAILKRPEVLQDDATTFRMHEACVMAGAVDGLFASQVLCDDGVPEPAHKSMVQLLRTIVEVGMTAPDSPGH